MATTQQEKAYCVLEFARTQADIIVKRNFEQNSENILLVGTAFAR